MIAAWVGWSSVEHSDQLLKVYRGQLFSCTVLYTNALSSFILLGHSRRRRQRRRRKRKRRQRRRKRRRGGEE